MSFQLQDFLRAAHPWSLAENTLHVLGENHLTADEQFGERIMPLLMLQEYVLGPFILLVDHLEHLVVDDLGGGVTIGALELIVLIVVADIGQLVAHASVSNHAICTLGSPLQVVHRSC